MFLFTIFFFRCRKKSKASSLRKLIVILTPKQRIHADVNMLWPEWKDSDLNNEKWEILKGELFLDAEPVTMPRSLEPDHWIRAKDLKNLTVLPLLFSML